MGQNRNPISRSSQNYSGAFVKGVLAMWMESLEAFGRDPRVCAQAVHTLAPKHLARDYLKANMYTV